MTSSEPSSSGVAPLLVLGKITEILDAFSLERASLSLGEIRESTGLPTSTVQRLVANMVWAGLLERHGDRLRIGLRMAYWAAPAIKAIDAIDLLLPTLTALRDRTGESASLFRAEQGHRVCVALSPTLHELRQEAYVGRLMPLLAGSAGRVLLAWNPELETRMLATTPAAGPVDRDSLIEAIRRTRTDGYAITSGERIDGAAGASVPVFDASGGVQFALTLSGPAVRFTAEAIQRWLPDLVDAGRAATRQIGGRPVL